MTGFDFMKFDALRKLDRVGRVFLVGSGKGGVGKSLIACGLGLRLSEAGHRVGILDADLHGASVPNYLGLSPPVSSGRRGLIPKESGNVKVMSIALFTGDNPVPMRGAGKQGLITELLALTDWGDLDYLIVDLPPSTGDELLAAFDLFKGKSILIVVTTPSREAMSVVSRLVRLAKTEKVPVAGAVLNMAFARTGRARAYPFGRATPGAVRAGVGAGLIVEVPLDPAVSRLGLKRALGVRGEFSEAFKKLARQTSSL
jgi:ATP-binding protein involved in chromosome partitioning